MLTPCISSRDSKLQPLPHPVPLLLRVTRRASRTCVLKSGGPWSLFPTGATVGLSPGDSSTLFHRAITQHAGGISPTWTQGQPSHAKQGSWCVPVCTPTCSCAVCPTRFFASNPVARSILCWRGEGNIKSLLGALCLPHFLHFL